MLGSRTSTAGVCHWPFRRCAPQMATSALPSALPPNHAARNSPGRTSTMVEAWQEGVGMGSATNSAVCARSGAASRSRAGIRTGGFILARGIEANIGSVAGRGKGFAFCGLGHEIGFVRHFVFRARRRDGPDGIASPDSIRVERPPFVPGPSHSAMCCVF